MHVDTDRQVGKSTDRQTYTYTNNVEYSYFLIEIYCQFAQVIFKN